MMRHIGEMPFLSGGGRLPRFVPAGTRNATFTVFEVSQQGCCSSSEGRSCRNLRCFYDEL